MATALRIVAFEVGDLFSSGGFRLIALPAR